VRSEKDTKLNLEADGRNANATERYCESMSNKNNSLRFNKGERPLRAYENQDGFAEYKDTTITFSHMRRMTAISVNSKENAIKLPRIDKMKQRIEKMKKPECNRFFNLRENVYNPNEYRIRSGEDECVEFYESTNEEECKNDQTEIKKSTTNARFEVSKDEINDLLLSTIREENECIQNGTDFVSGRKLLNRNKTTDVVSGRKRLYPNDPNEYRNNTQRQPTQHR
jgi:hypothetical protein